jgi:DNA-directed RNA polymerase sigma subunit (sigma70/sigma32)
MQAERRQSEERRSAGLRLTREQRRSRRKRAVRARTVSVKRMAEHAPLSKKLSLEVEEIRPKARMECLEAPRPCPHVSCRHHLYLDVSSKTGAIKLNFPDLEVWELPISCALDVADDGGRTLEDIGEIMNLTRERIRQLELKALSKLEAVRDMRVLRELAGDIGISSR